MQDSIDPKRRAGLEQDVAELDWLVDEILLASRLDAVADVTATEEIDLLALAAEECAHYDEAQLEGARVSVQGDARLLRRLLRNLLENARRHGAPPTQVRIAYDAGVATIVVIRVRACRRKSLRTCFSHSTAAKTHTIRRARASASRWCGRLRAVTPATPAAR